MAMASRPQFLRCAVVWAAVTDLTGQSETGIAATELASRSPIGQANAITGPVLLAHGDKDLMAPMVKAEAFHKAVKLSSTASEWLVYRDEGHILRDPVNIADFYNRMARFLDSHLST
jgi:dipeptidyl aminopeptidase/acylaminoacyl peptidase